MPEMDALISSHLKILDASRDAFLALWEHEKRRQETSARLGALDWEKVPFFMNLTEAARLLGISRQAMTDISREPGFPGSKIGSGWIVDTRKLREWIISHPHLLGAA